MPCNIARHGNVSQEILRPYHGEHGPAKSPMYPGVYIVLQQVL
jgi:hypothetical protein